MAHISVSAHEDKLEIDAAALISAMRSSPSRLENLLWRYRCAGFTTVKSLPRWLHRRSWSTRFGCDDDHRPHHLDFAWRSRHTGSSPFAKSFAWTAKAWVPLCTQSSTPTERKPSWERATITPTDKVIT